MAPTPSCWSSCRGADAIRMVGNLLGAPDAPVTIGAEVEAVFEPHDEATPPYTLVQWRLVD